MTRHKGGKVFFGKSVPILLFLLIPFCLPEATAGEIHVGSGKKFPSIKTALAEANPGDTIYVHEGVYNENSMVLNKPITLIGIDRPTIDGRGEQEEIFTIDADSVHITGFLLKNVGVSYRRDLAAIRVNRSGYGSIVDNVLENTFFGIYLAYGKHYLVADNRVSGSFETEVSAGNAIHVWKGNNIEIRGNTLTGHRDGIYFEFVDDSYIADNYSHNNIRYGLHFMFSNRDVYEHNTFRDNGAGVAVMFSGVIEMKGNHFVENKGGASYGLLLKEISDGNIHENTFSNNTIGIMSEGANRILIEKNQFTSNGKGISMQGNSLDVEVTENNFLANTFEVVTNTQHNVNLYHRNYWSSYAGYDLDRDGVGDLPYRPVNLFARITNSIPAATFLIHSFFVNMLDAAEKLFPEMIPADLKDDQPMMKPYPYDYH